MRRADPAADNAEAWDRVRRACQDRDALVRRNWSSGTVPGAGDDVVFDGATATFLHH